MHQRLILTYGEGYGLKQFLDYLASEQAQVLINWGVEGKHYVIENGKRVVPADVQKRIIEDNEAFKKESGVFLVWMT